MDIIKELQNINKLNKKTFVAISKYHSTDEIIHAYNLGFKNFGESKLQDLELKVDILKQFDDINWHFIGRLQSNKIKKIIQYSSLIHSVSSMKYINIINNEAKKIDKIQNILLQVNVDDDYTKAGFNINELLIFLPEIFKYDNICIKGIMVIGPNTEDKIKINASFIKSKLLFDKIKQDYQIDILSMGMSNDYKLALNNGSNCFRIGSLLFNNIKKTNI